MVSKRDDIEFSLEEISVALSIPKETCRQILLMALRKLSSSKNKQKFQDIAEIIAMIEKV